MALLNLFDPRTGMPLAILDATAITEMRTGAVSGLPANLSPYGPERSGFAPLAFSRFFDPFCFRDSSRWAFFGFFSARRRPARPVPRAKRKAGESTISQCLT
jgi:hypothetical protein